MIKLYGEVDKSDPELLLQLEDIYKVIEKYGPELVHE